MSASWVIQSNYINISQITPLAETLRAHQIPMVDVSVIPFSQEFLTPLEDPTTNVIPYGSTALIKIAEARGWKHLYFDRAKFRANVWNQNRDDMLNADAEFMTVAEAMTRFKMEPEESLWFIRPVEDLKHFSGTVTTAKEIAHWTSSKDSGSFSFGTHTEVAISSPKYIMAEWRYFIVGGQVVTGSRYRFMGELSPIKEDDPMCTAEAQAMADKWLPHETVVMDLALTDDGMKVIEFNCLNCSGFYANDVEAFALAVTGYANEHT